VALLVVMGVLLSGRLAAASDPTSKGVITYTVAKGQNLWTIANKYRVSVAEIVRWNELKNPNQLYIGQILNIYSKDITADERGFSRSDLELLARIIYAEARGEDFEGQVAVGAVVLNRLKHPDFPKTLRAVVYQPGAFTAVNDRQIRLSPDQTARRAAEDALKGMDPTEGAIFYYNPSTAQDRWIKTRPVLRVIGNHTFSS